MHAFSHVVHMWTPLQCGRAVPCKQLKLI